jgi:hypothetical protein
MMDGYNGLGRWVVTTAAGCIDLSLAEQEDGAVTLVAWLLSTGRRVGYLRCDRRRLALADFALDPAWRGLGVESAVRKLLHQQFGLPVPTSQAPATAGAIRSSYPHLMPSAWSEPAVTTAMS